LTIRTQSNLGSKRRDGVSVNIREGGKCYLPATHHIQYIGHLKEVRGSASEKERPRLRAKEMREEIGKRKGGRGVPGRGEQHALIKSQMPKPSRRRLYGNRLQVGYTMLEHQGDPEESPHSISRSTGLQKTSAWCHLLGQKNERAKDLEGHPPR